MGIMMLPMVVMLADEYTVYLLKVGLPIACGLFQRHRSLGGGGGGGGGLRTSYCCAAH